MTPKTTFPEVTVPTLGWAPMSGGDDSRSLSRAGQLIWLTSERPCFRSKVEGLGRWLRAPAVLAWDPKSIPCTITGQLTSAYNSNSKGYDTLFWPPEASAIVCVLVRANPHTMEILKLSKK